MPRMAAIEDMLTTAPPRARRWGSALLLISMAPFRLTATIRFHASSSKGSPPPPTTAALLTRMSRWLKRSTTSATARSHSSLLVMSATTTMPVPPIFSITSRVLAARPGETSMMPTCAPWLANRTAVATPMPGNGPPEPAPVTMATLPARRRAGSEDRKRSSSNDAGSSTIFLSSRRPGRPSHAGLLTPGFSGRASQDGPLRTGFSGRAPRGGSGRGVGREDALGEAPPGRRAHELVAIGADDDHRGPPVDEDVGSHRRGVAGHLDDGVGHHVAQAMDSGGERDELVAPCHHLSAGLQRAVLDEGVRPTLGLAAVDGVVVAVEELEDLVAVLYQ